MRRWRTLTRRGGAHKVRFTTTQSSAVLPRGDLMKVWRAALILSSLLLLPSGAMAAPAGKVVIAQGVDPSTLDTMNQQETPASVVATHLFDTLVERDANLKVVPALAAELPRLVSDRVWELKLRKGVKFHNGEEFNAESVKFSLERVKDAKLRASSNFRPIDHVEIVDPYTARVHTSKPWPTFTTIMTFRQASMYPPKAYAGKDTAFISKNPIGTGPYKLVRWSKDEEIVLEADPGHWRGAPRIKTVLDGKAMRVATMLTPLHFGFDPSLKPVKQDVAKAKKLLADAGLPNGVEITLNGPQGRYVRDKEVAEAVTGQLAKAGIKATLRTHEFVAYLNNLIYKHKGGPVWLIGWGTPTLDAETIYGPLFRTGANLTSYSNPELDRLFDEAQAIMDEKKRLAEYHQINKLWVEDAAAVPLYQQLDLYGASKRLNWKARSDELIKAYDMALKDGK